MDAFSLTSTPKTCLTWETLPEPGGSASIALWDRARHASLLTTTRRILEGGNFCPVAEPEVFKGDSLEYPSWVASFDLLIKTNNVPPAEQLFYLKKYVAGEPKEMLGGYFHATLSRSIYCKARDMLEERCDSFKVANSLGSKLETGKIIVNRSNGTEKVV